MKSLVRWGATLGLVGSTLVSSWLSSNLRALALTETEVMTMLQPVPVFTVTDSNGSPLVASVPKPGQEETQQAVAGVFISPQDAQAFVERLKKDKPDLGNQVLVQAVSLSDIYQLDQKNEQQSANDSEGLDFAFVPRQQQVQLAQQLLVRNGQTQQQFQGVPLFYAKGGPEKGYLTVKQEDGTQVIPFFFEQGQLQAMVENFKRQNPNIADSVTMEVVPLENVIDTLETSDNKQLNNIVLVPSQESISFIQSLQNSSRQGTPQAPATNRPQN
ncbi:MAG: hypothetical protein F6K36_10295 [Symploca sp. SIO3C6]|uniref:Tic22 family protein n=1 Tax=Symploca sp. SIO1C4 TaxID=2607765 RepID=A0A6B3MXF7_9CYAN|nr:hypothetical protein [Symploca sp. SIO3C6]NER26116.1 hypothetical protein [Symploca sp. SIO1C4]NET04951.1 hypothetical protein [Symploca sp. SIO2B6]